MQQSENSSVVAQPTEATLIEEDESSDTGADTDDGLKASGNQTPRQGPPDARAATVPLSPAGATTSEPEAAAVHVFPEPAPHIAAVVSADPSPQSTRHNSVGASGNVQPVVRRESNASVGKEPSPVLKKRASSLMQVRYEGRTIADVIKTAGTLPWFYGRMSLAATERLLLEKGEAGEFIVRFDPAAPDRLFLSFNDGMGVQHCPISIDSASSRLHLTMDSVVSFTALSRLVAFYQKNCLATTHFQLTRPFGPEAFARAGPVVLATITPDRAPHTTSADPTPLHSNPFDDGL